MPDRLTEIRARLDAATADMEWPTNVSYWDRERPEDRELLAHAPADIAWLLAELTLRDEDVEDIYDLRDQVNAAMDTIYHLTGPGDALIAATDYYAERVKVQRETRRPHSA